jgi:hypothetical protein
VPLLLLLVRSSLLYVSLPFQIPHPFRIYISLYIDLTESNYKCWQPDEGGDDRNDAGGDAEEEDLDEEALSWRVSSDQFQMIKSNSDLRQALRDPSLQKTLVKIDAATNRDAALAEAMKDERFKDFVDTVLITIGVCERGPDGFVVFTG